jgi:exosortase/archaeosortase family protein
MLKPRDNGAPVPAEARSADVRRDRRAQLGFVLKFVLTAGVLLTAYYFPYPPEGCAKAFINEFLHVYAASAAIILRPFDPTVRVVGQEIMGAFSMRIVQTCDAMDVTILLGSAIVSWRGPIGRRLLAALFGALALGVLNVARICSLYWIGVVRPSLFEAAHLDVWPAVILIVAVAFFFGFTFFEQREQGAALP